MFESENTFELYPEMTSFENKQFEFGQSEWGEVFNEGELMELTAEFLEITNEWELDRFLGELIEKAGGATARWRNPPKAKRRGAYSRASPKKPCRLPAAQRAAFSADLWEPRSVAVSPRQQEVLSGSNSKR